MDNTLFRVLHKTLECPIAFHRVFATVGGGAAEGLFLSQAYYWSQRTKDSDGWFYKVRSDWTIETALTRKEQEAARKKLKRIGILEEKTEGLPRKLFFKVNINALFIAIANLESSNPRGCQLVQSCQLAGTIVPTGGYDRANYLYTETTTQINTETTNTEACAEKFNFKEKENGDFTGTESQPTLLKEKESGLTQQFNPGDKKNAAPRSRNESEIEELRTIYSDHKPESWADCVKLNKTRLNGFKALIAEYGDVEELRKAWISAIAFIESDNWWKNECSSRVIDTLLRRGNVTRFRDSYLVKNPAVKNTPAKSGVSGVDFAGMYDAQHEILHRTHYSKSGSLNEFFNKCSWHEDWLEFAIARYPDWNWQLNQEQNNVRNS